MHAVDARVLNFGKVKVRSGIEFVDVHHDARAFDVTDNHEVKQAVVKQSIGGDFHAAAEVARVGDAEIRDDETRFRTVIEFEAQHRLRK